jgi:hypothetical protein
MQNEGIKWLGFKWTIAANLSKGKMTMYNNKHRLAV